MDEAELIRKCGGPGGVRLSRVLTWVLAVHVVLFGVLYAHYRLVGTGARASDAGNVEFGPRPDVGAGIVESLATNASEGFGVAMQAVPEDPGSPACEPSDEEKAGLNAWTNRLACGDHATPDLAGGREGGPAPEGAAAVSADGLALLEKYVVRQGDSLWGVARRRGIPVAALRRANGLVGDRLRAGQVLRVPQVDASVGGVDGAMDRVEGPARETQRAGAGKRHVVGTGDTLFGIARRYGVSVDDLASANGIADPRKVRLGCALTIPQ